jgi:hypothetical protein
MSNKNWNFRYSNDDFSNGSPESSHTQSTYAHGRSIGRNVQAIEGLHPSHPLHDLTYIAEKLHGKAIAAHSTAATAHKTDNDSAMMYSGRAIALSDAANAMQDEIELLHPEHYFKV